LSAVTKLFVVLLVTCSLLMTAGMVVFVSRTEDYNRKYEGEKNAHTRTRQQLADLDNQVKTLTAKIQNLTGENIAQVNALNQKISDAARQIEALNVQIAKLNSEKAILTANNTSATEAIKGLQDLVAQQRTEIAALREKMTEVLRQNSDLSAMAADLEKKQNATERERRWLAEQLAEARGELEAARKVLAEKGLTPRSPVQPGVAQPPINGVIREVKPINGIPYATISVGSADNVQQGMRFQVINARSGEFFGVLIIDTVRQNEAIGRLEGPRVAEVRPGLEVRTQL